MLIFHNSKSVVSKKNLLNIQQHISNILDHFPYSYRLCYYCVCNNKEHKKKSDRKNLVS